MKDSRVISLAVFLVLAMATTSFAADANIGTWKLNLAKSKIEPGPAPKSETLKVESWGDNGVKLIYDGVGADGKPFHNEYSAKYDGKDYPTGPDSTTSYKRIDGYNFEGVGKINGKIATKTKVSVSKDGKTTTVDSKGTDAQGRAVHNIVVYDRQ